ncbi:MAG TPA: phage holin family protein [Candidatus Dormibacteraeota bacterium]|nr:phage holin family protein [Candidatus Dormibacteraeota bacterium]
MLTRFLIHIVALLFVFYIVWGIRGSNLWAAVVLALILALVNAIIRPVLLILTLPITLLTLGLFVIVLNALLFALSFAVLNGIMNLHIALSFGQILIGYLIYAVASFVLTRLL